MTEIFYSLAHTAQRLKMSTGTLRKHVQHGNIRCEPIGFGKKRKHLRFTDQNIATFIKKIKVTGVAPCPSSDTPTLDFGKLNSKSTVILFESLQKPPTKKKQKQ